MKINRNISRVIVISLTVVASSTGVCASEPWTLDQCIDYAIKHNLTVKTRQNETLSAEYELTEAKDRFLPTLQGYASENFSFGRGLTSENTYANRNTQNFNVGVGLNLPIFQGLAGIRRVDYAKANLRMAVEQLEAEKDNVELNVISLYLQVLYNRAVADLAREQLRLSQIELERRHQLVDGGKLPELDLYEAQAQVAQDELSVVTGENDVRLALVDLAQTLELDDIDGFDIASLPGDTTPDIYPSADEVFRSALGFNHGLRASELAVEAADRNITLAKSGWIPTLSFSAGLSTNYYRLGGYTSPSFSSQMRDNLSKSIGFSLSVPIFDGLTTRNNLRRARLQRFNAELQLADTRNRLYKSIQQAWYQADGARQRLESATVAENSQLKAFEGVSEKYNFGKATSTEYEQARGAWVRATLQRIQANYELLLRSRILRFYGRPTIRR
ncbi:MAG: TolC family protein [Clostridium sp.]|nr:TolC family protein [Clostridium sp.]